MEAEKFNTTVETAGVSEVTTTQTPEITPDQPKHPSKKPWLILLIILLICTLVSTLGYVLYAKSLTPFKKKASPAQSQSLTAPTSVKTLSNEEVFDEMLKQSLKTTSYKVSMTHKQTPTGTPSSSYEPLSYSYTADVDSKNPEDLKINAIFKFAGSASGAYTDFEGQTIFSGQYLYTKATKITGTLGSYYYGASSCAKCAPVPKSPTAAQLKAGYVRTKRGDLVQNATNADYIAYIDPVFNTNAPLSAFPLLNLSDTQQASVLQLIGNHDAGIHRLYDGKIETVNGVETVYFTVLSENYKVKELSKFLEDLMKIPGNDTDPELREYALENTLPGEMSPGHYFKIWIDKKNNNLVKVISLVDNKDLPTRYETTLEFSAHNQPVTITVPSNFIAL